MPEPITILKGVGGSTAHGLSTPDSDVDMLGVFAYPTESFWELQRPQESIVTTEPDYASHELEKFLRLAMSGNPTMLEMLYLDEYVEKEEYWGNRLIFLRTHIVSAEAVRKSYIGYAYSQLQKAARHLETIDQGQPIRRSSSRKNIRHLFRLMEQGFDLYTKGRFYIRVKNPAEYAAIEDMTMVEIEQKFSKLRERFYSATTCLPESPDYKFIGDYLRDYRRQHIMEKIQW